MPSLERSTAELQRREAPLLREMTINHLLTSDEVVARGFRGEYQPCYSEHYKTFLAKQREKGVWATDIEAAALAELMKFNLVVTPINGTKSQEKICLYRAADKNAPTIHLYNSNNTHWYFEPCKPYATVGDGNCLYNAIAQALHAQQNINESIVPSTMVNTARQGFFSDAVIQHQQAISAAIAKHATPAQLEENLKNEGERISRLPLEQQKQIADDYAYALKVARHELDAQPRAPKI